VQLRFLKFLLAAFWLLWAGVVIPSHTVGIIQVPGVSTAGSSCPMCRTTDTSRSRGQQSSGKQRSSSGCAICNFTAKLSAGTNLDCNLHGQNLRHSAADGITHRCITPHLPEPSASRRSFRLMLAPESSSSIASFWCSRT
jgi:hypothetical protein